MRDNKPNYPYTYGDEGGSFESLNYLKKYRNNLKNYDNNLKKYIKHLLIISIAFIPLTSIPIVVYAQNSTEILLRIEEALTALEKADRSTKCRPSISPAGGVACIAAGICLEHARANVGKGNLQLAVAFGCGAAVAICGERLLDANGV